MTKNYSVNKQQKSSPRFTLLLIMHLCNYSLYLTILFVCLGKILHIALLLRILLSKSCVENKDNSSFRMSWTLPKTPLITHGLTGRASSSTLTTSRSFAIRNWRDCRTLIWVLRMQIFRLKCKAFANTSAPTRGQMPTRLFMRRSTMPLPGGTLKVTLYTTLAFLIVLFAVSVSSSCILMNYLDVTEIIIIFDEIYRNF